MITSDVILTGISLSEEMDIPLGDPRRTKRAQKIIEAFEKNPEKSFPDIFMDDSDLEAFYRFIDNVYVSVNELLGAHKRLTALRSQTLGKVLVIHDTTEMSFPLNEGHLRKHLCKISSKRQGFWVHTALVVSADGLRAPLGVIGLRPYAHEKGLHDKEALRFWGLEYGLMDRESDRWLETVETTQESLKEVKEVIHVMDREGDIYGLMASMHLKNQRFVIRASHDRILEGESSEPVTRLFDILEHTPVVATRMVDLTARTDGNRPPQARQRFPARGKRAAVLSFRAITIQMPKPQNQPHLKGLPASIPVNVIEAVEVEVPPGETPVRWLLLTTEPIDTLENILLAVDIYRSRWLIEEFFKAVGTGCGYNNRQLESAQHLLIALALTIPVAWKLLVLRHLERQCPEAPAELLLSEPEIYILKHANPKHRWSPIPTIGEALQAIAKLGGHLKSNGRPGWLTISRGYQELWNRVAGWNAAMQMFREQSG